MEDRLSQLTEEFKKIYQENEFNEIKIDRIKTQLTNLTKELDQFRNVRIKKENTSFIEKFSVVVSSETCQEKKVNQTDLNKNQTKLTEDFNRSSNTSNPIDSSPLVDINSIHLSSAHDTGSKTDQTHQEFVDLQDEPYGTDNERHATFSSDFENGSIDLLSSNNDGTSSTSVRFRNATNQHAHDDNKDTRASGKPSHRIDQYEGYDYNEKASFSGSKSDVASQNSNINDSDEFRNSSTRASFNISGRMHRGRRGLYREQRRSGVRDNPGAGRGSASRNCFNCNKPGHFRRECPEERKLRDNGGDGFHNSDVKTHILKNRMKRTVLFILPIISTLLQCHADELSNRKHPPSPLCLIISSTCERALQIEYEADRMLDTSLEPDIRRLESLGLSSKEERRADHLNKSILLFDPGRESDRKTAPELILKLSRVGQVIPVLLKKFGDVGNIEFYHDDQNNHLNRQHQTSRPTVGTTSVGATIED
ncbi:unnamed protein product [Rotaria sordida]|uniref:CCHC-type domain-containing protein n=1 Tax=Rotaria sordida TaxID=392033 RepID=A0A819J602_9BILA|nr:unnamed protein product [Rotaria sordida]